MIVTHAETVSGKEGRVPNKRMQPTALSRALLVVLSFVQVSFPVSSVGSAVRRLMRGPLDGETVIVPSSEMDQAVWLRWRAPQPSAEPAG